MYDCDEYIEMVEDLLDEGETMRRDGDEWWVHHCTVTAPSLHRHCTIPAGELWAVGKVAHCIQYNAGQVIVKEGIEGMNFFLLFEGETVATTEVRGWG